MNVDNYFMKISDIPRNTKNSSKFSINAEDEREINAMPEATSMDTNSGSMDPSIVQALDKIANTLTKVMTSRLLLLMEDIKEQTSQLQIVAIQVGEAEQ